MNLKVKNMIYCSLFAGITAILAQIRIDLPSLVPITLQTLGIYLFSLVLKPKLACITALTYILIGAIGLPVFAGFRGGLATLLGPTGGYIFSFPIVSLIIALILKYYNSLFTKIIALVSATASCYFIGTLWFMFISSNNLITALSMCVIPFIPGDIIKMCSALFLAHKLKKNVRSYN